MPANESAAGSYAIGAIDQPSFARLSIVREAREFLVGKMDTDQSSPSDSCIDVAVGMPGYDAVR